MNNVKAKIKYISYITKQWQKQHYFMRAQRLHNMALINGTFDSSDFKELQELDKQITHTLLTGEEQCAKNDKDRDPWSPELCMAGLHLSYWKKKYRMSLNKSFRWHILDSLYARTTITLQEHNDTDQVNIKLNLRQARRQWKIVKAKGNELRQSFLQERAEEYALKRNMNPAQALKAIKQAEQSKLAYIQINDIIGGRKQKTPLTQIEVLTPDAPNGTRTTLTEKIDIENAIIARNQNHSRQSLSTPFHSIPELAEAINPSNPNHKIDDLLNGTFIDSLAPEISLSPTERQWIQHLQRRINTEIDSHITTQEFINFFNHRKEKTSSSPSGRHYGHYKIIAQLAEEGNTEIVETLLFIINISVATSSPLERWKQSSQIMIEKGKGNYIEHLRIIQLCEADLNFILNILWGHRMIQTALQQKALDESQYAIPGQTCNSAVWNKVLYCDLLRQTLQPGIMTDYDATAAFDRVLHAMTIVICRRFGMPQDACLFIYNLLHNMEFHVVTGLGQSQLTFANNADLSLPGQGVLQGSSSAAPIYSVNSDVSLTSYRKLASGAAFTNPISNVTIHDHATQYVDDKTDMLNMQGIINNTNSNSSSQPYEHLFNFANKNSNIWAELQWMSGGDLNFNKCFSYYIDPHYNYKTDRIKYTSKYKAPGEIIITNPATKQPAPIIREEPHTARRTLGVHLAPNGNSNTQTKVCIEKAKAFLGKLKHSKLPQQTKWKAITTVMSPGVLYPLVASTCTKDELDRIDRVIASAKCNALGLNEHFPRALLYGPLRYGGMQLPTAHASTIINRINYFLYNTHMSTNIGQKLEISLAFTQLETGLLQPFLTSSYELYGKFATSTLMKCLWAQTEPFGLYLKPNADSYWLPKLQGSGDIAIMDDVTKFYDKESCIKLNRCRLYLQVITLYDLITYDGSKIHPEYISGQRPTSRKSTMHWVDFHKPPRKYMAIWKEYMMKYVQPRLPILLTSWNPKAPPHYNTTYYLSLRTGKLYGKVHNGRFHMHEASRTQPGSRTTTFHPTYSETDICSDTENSLKPVDVAHSNQQITILCFSNINNHKGHLTSIQYNYSFYRKLPKSLRRLCGQISIPPDGGDKLMTYIKDRDANLIGVSDASVIDGNGTHAWILTTGEKEHLSDPYMKLEGHGPVDGDKSAMSSARGELQGQTALTIITEAFLSAHNETDMEVTFYTDNQGVQKSCNHPKIRRIGHHRKANMDLQMEQATRAT
jgi:hypothetical protein